VEIITGTPPARKDTARETRAALWAAIPGALRERPQWVLAAPDKSPRTHTGSHASAIDPRTWCSFNTAAHAAYSRGWHIGYVLHETDPFTCIDLDVKDDTTPDQMARFQSVVDAFKSYSEFSRSGRGMHVWICGKIGYGRRRDGVEVYSQERFMICTGNVYLAAPIQNRQELLSQLVAEIDRYRLDTTVQLLEVPPVDCDLAVYHKARPKHTSEKFDALWRGDWQSLGYPSQSEADEALLSYLVHATDSNEQVRRIFRMSGLGQRKKAQRDAYLNYTLKRFRAKQESVRQWLAHAMQGNFA
jgi:primase-polymerase (primpol)-like protein